MRISIAVVLTIASPFHVDHEQVDFVTVGETEYDEVIEEYEEELFTQEGDQELVGTDFADPAPAQGKPRCITPIIFKWSLNILYDMHLRYRHFMETTCIIISTMSPTSTGRVVAMLRMSVA